MQVGDLFLGTLSEHAFLGFSYLGHYLSMQFGDILLGTLLEQEFWGFLIGDFT